VFLPPPKGRWEERLTKFMKVFSKGDIKFLEQCAVDSGVSMKSLMDRAGINVSSFIMKLEPDIKEKQIAVICGKGNNGGDGFVCADRLFKHGAAVSIILAQGEPATELAKESFSNASQNIPILKWPDMSNEIKAIISRADYIVDAIYGFGFSGTVKDPIDSLITFVNRSSGTRISVDLPSGTECDTAKVGGTCFKADYTVTFTALKPANVLLPAADFCGKNIIVSVGINRSFSDTMPGCFLVNQEKEIASRFSVREKDSNKGTYGRLLMICGSYGMAGACIMAAKAALRSGIGLLNIALDKSIYPIVAQSVPEAIFTVMDFSDDMSTKESSNSLFDALKKATACLVGCGIGKEAFRYVPTVLKFAECPLILDADALNYLSQHSEELSDLSVPVIITPHPGEMARLISGSVATVQSNRIETARNYAEEKHLYVVLKGTGTVIAGPGGDITINTTGNPGMATGGSGDVLAGIISSLCAQGLSPYDSMTAGTYIHGRAGDICAKELSEHSMLPTDIIEKIPSVFLRLEQIAASEHHHY
jgi:hydroxyethylthiazole kinase-like uncharacterized protein yjeF